MIPTPAYNCLNVWVSCFRHAAAEHSRFSTLLGKYPFVMTWNIRYINNVSEIYSGNIFNNEVVTSYSGYEPLRESFGLSISHYNDVIMSAVASQITSLKSVYSTVLSGADPRKHQSSASLAFVRGIHRWPVNSPHKGPVTRRMLPFDDVIMWGCNWRLEYSSSHVVVHKNGGDLSILANFIDQNDSYYYKNNL